MSRGPMWKEDGEVAACRSRALQLQSRGQQPVLLTSATERHTAWLCARPMRLGNPVLPSRAVAVMFANASRGPALIVAPRFTKLK